MLHCGNSGQESPPLPLRLWQTGPVQLSGVAMTLRCLFGMHRPSLGSIARKKTGYTALCDGCGIPLQRREDGRWGPCEPLYETPGRRSGNAAS